MFVWPWTIDEAILNQGSEIIIEIENENNRSEIVLNFYTNADIIVII